MPVAATPEQIFTLASSSVSRAPNFAGSTLVLPSPNSIANLGQLSADLVTSTLDLPLVGWLGQGYDLLLPLVGNDPLGRGKRQDGSIDVAGETELYHSDTLRLTVLQIRSAVIKGRLALFTPALSSWIRHSQFSRVIVLGSADASRRSDGDIALGPLRSLVPRPPTEASQSRAGSSLAELAGVMGIVPLDFASYDSQNSKDVDPTRLPGSGPLLKIVEALNEAGAGTSSLDVVGVVGFAVEGDNLSDAMLLSSVALSLLASTNGVPREAAKTIKVPASWSSLYGGWDMTEKVALFG
ncbi:hypothetical protein M427DRAFT_62342 [Gonapodya prolifera JEL478]|uniref:Proteasome assembly chaperone 2 n=1 Tax=Gonapodya prolifera (strain JEL478) TaxID=1344416 RepID=A0A139A169_GONPJ|nr:hypothetical protein M427DRAFT_62342 [Gonapodya prolifera JEL478]|eukprot:KXS10368.1 hypothetical protein M427DRAFT_62342 [Gonapodya prolifera JEL478]